MISTSSRWVPESPMFVGDLSLKAECGSRTPWHALARPGMPWHALAHASVETCGSPGFHAGHGLDLVLALSCMSYCPVSSCCEVIPGGTKATIVGVDDDGDLPVFTDDGKTMVP